MGKVVIGAVVFGVAVAVLRRFGPALGQRAMTKCEEMFDRMPEEFPPKRLMHDIHEIREQNVRILRELGEDKLGRTTMAATA